MRLIQSIAVLEPDVDFWRWRFAWSASVKGQENALGPLVLADCVEREGHSMAPTFVRYSDAPSSLTSAACSGVAGVSLTFESQGEVTDPAALMPKRSRSARMVPRWHCNRDGPPLLIAAYATPKEELNVADVLHLKSGGNKGEKSFNEGGGRSCDLGERKALASRVRTVRSKRLRRPVGIEGQLRV